MKLVGVFNILQPEIDTPINNMAPLGMRVISCFNIERIPRESLTLSKAIEFGNSEWEQAKAYQEDTHSVVMPSRRLISSCMCGN